MSPVPRSDSLLGRRAPAHAMLLLGLLALPPAARPQSLPSFSETLDVRLIELDVTVTDRQGAPVRGLQRDDFEITLDGRRVDSDFFSESESGDSGPLSLLLLVDSRTLRHASRERAFREVAPQLGGLLADPQRRLRVVHSDGRVQVVEDWTRDTADVEAALARISALPTFGESVDALEAPAQQALQGILSNLRGGRRDRIVAMASIDAVMSEMRSFAAQGVRETEEILLGLQSVVRSLAMVPGPKAVVYLTGGWAVRPGAGAMNRIQSALSGSTARDNDPAASAVSQSDTPGTTVITDGGFMTRDVGPEILRRRQWMEGLDLHAELDLLIATANAYRIRFFPVMAPPGDAAAADARGRARGTLEVSDIREGPLRLAEHTGGRAFLSETSIVEVLGEIESSLHHRYSLAVHDTAEPPPPVREIEVRVRLRGADVRFPHRHAGRTLEGRLLDLALAALDRTAGANPHQLELSSLAQSPGSDGRRRVQLALTFPIDRLGLADASGLHQASSQIAVAVLDRKGTLRDQQHLQVPLQIPDADLEKARASYYRAAIELQLDPGPHRVAVALWDSISQSASMTVHEIEVGSGEPLPPD